MDWIKKNYDQFALGIIAAGLLGISALTIFRAKSFGDTFAEANAPVVPSERVPELDLSAVQSAQKLLDAPVKWEPPKGKESIFIPQRYQVNNGTLSKVILDFNFKDSLTGQPIPNSWIIDNKLSLTDKATTTLDPDNDGFPNEDEWRGERDNTDPNKWGGSTDPNDPKSHPRYVTKLFLKKWIRQPFRLLFQAYDGDPKKPDSLSFQINAIDRGRKTEFLKIGEKVPNSPYQVEKFEQKNLKNPSTDAEEDVSELTIKNTETGDPVILVLTKVTDSPDSYGLFDYEWGGLPPIQVKKLQEFVLKPETDKRYKLIDIKEGDALIRLPDGKEYHVVPDPRKH